MKRYGPWAVVTGASSGIGREMARQLAAQGLSIVLVARSAATLEAVARELPAGGARVLPLDLSERGAVERLLEATVDLQTGLLVHAAGFGSGGAFLDQPLDRETAMLNVNCRAALELAHGFGCRFAARGGGGIVLMSSIVAFQGVPRSAHYAATKAYVQSLGEALADEWKADGVDVLVAAPGPTHSGFAARAGMKFGGASSAEEVARETISALGRKSRVVPGWRSKMLFGSLMTAPRTVRVRIMKAVMKSMT